MNNICAIINCHYECSSFRPNHLPTCANHYDTLKNNHQEYKKFSKLTQHANETINIVKSPIDLLKVYKIKYISLRNEINCRLDQTNLIKPEYRDKGHFYYLTPLIDELKSVKKIIKNIEKNIENSNHPNAINS